MLGFLLYANTLGHGYVLDDVHAIWLNRIVKSGLNAESVKLILTTEYRHGVWDNPGSLYRPIPLLMFAAEWGLSPNNPRVGHLVNVLLYALTGWLLWVALRRVLAGQPPAVVAAAVLLFMAHPVHTEVVANIKSRDEILALLFGTAALYAVWRHLDRGSVPWLIGAVLLYALALFSKESAITLLAMFPLTIWFFHDAPAARKWPVTARVSLLMLVPAVAYLLVRRSVVGPDAHLMAYTPLDVVYMATDDRLEQLATAFMMSGRHLWTLVFPHPLISDMGYPQVVPVGLGDRRALAGLAVYGGLFVVALAGLRRKRFHSYAILFYLITFSVASNILIFVSTYAERMLYLPSLGFVLLLAWALAKLGRSRCMPAMLREVGGPGTREKVFHGAVAVVLVLYGTLTVARNADWRSEFDLFAADLPKSPDCAMLNHHFGNEALKKGLDEDGAVVDTGMVVRAIAAQTRAIELFPGYTQAFAERGIGWLALARYDEARRELEYALTYLPNLAYAWSGLGVVHYRTGLFSEAEECFNKAISVDPGYMHAHRSLGNLLVKTGRLPEAIAQWEEGLNHDPDNGTLRLLLARTWTDTGSAQYEAQQLTEAEGAFRKAIQYTPHFVDAHQGLGTVLAVTGRLPKAIEQWEEGLKHDPDNETLRFFIASAWSNLGSTQYAAQQLTEAEASFRKALSYDPHLVDAHRNLGAVLAVTGRLPEAIEQWKEGLEHDPDNGTLLFFIGSAYRDMGREDLAQPWLERADEQGGGGGVP